MNSYTKVANGDIRPSRFVKLDTTEDGKVLECDAGDKVFGVSQEGTRNVPFSSLDDGLAAVAGENLHVYGMDQVCMLELGDTAAVGDRLKSDADGKGVPTTTDLDEYGAIAEVAGVSGDLIPVRVYPARQVSAA